MVCNLIRKKCNSIKKENMSKCSEISNEIIKGVLKRSNNFENSDVVFIPYEPFEYIMDDKLLSELKNVFDDEPDTLTVAQRIKEILDSRAVIEYGFTAQEAMIIFGIDDVIKILNGECDEIEVSIPKCLIALRNQ